MACSARKRGAGRKWRRPSAGAARGFTLVELLVVVALIALLVSLILPALGATRAAAQTSVCAAQLRQWGVAMEVYAHDNNMYLPRRGQGVQVTWIIDRPEDWFNVLPPFFNSASYHEQSLRNDIPRPGRRSVWVCPAAVDWGTLNYFSYAMNMRLSVWLAGTPPDRLDRVAPPAVQVFMADGPGGHCSVLPSVLSYSPQPRHQGQANVLFLDGHGRAYTGAYLGCGVKDPHRDDVQWAVPGSAWSGPNQ